ncbi:DUF7350 domain-containing protein [Halobacterium yunchengense]|uniref:DUF7350 domain-containing protein n=1 Tax=Halobacterium yunchengense TaxID=3108497 RepID=UPI003009604E
MRRRGFLAGAGATGLAGLAGCLGLLETERASREPPLPENRPDAAYVPSHYEGMEMAGAQTKRGVSCVVSYTFPHRFWLVRDADTDRVNVKGADDLHLMVSVWDEAAGVVLAAASPQVEYTGPEGETESFSPWQMVSQRMGVHYGDNVTLGPEGVYDVTVRVPPPGTRRSGGDAPAEDVVEFDFELTFDNAVMDDLAFRDIPGDREGTEGAVDPMDMPGVAQSQAPAADDFPVDVNATAETGGARLVVAAVDSLGDLAAGDDETYLAASLRTPHNRFVLPAAGLAATVDAGGETAFDGELEPAVDPGLGYHYGAVVPAGGVDGGTVRVDTPPQVSRHEGYETAFFDFEDVSL